MTNGNIQERILERVTFYETKTEGKPARFVRAMSENEDPMLQALRRACDGEEDSCGSYRSCLAMYYILASAVLNTDGNGFLSEFSIRRALSLDYELKEQEICMKTLVKCGLILQLSVGGSVQYAILDEQCARLKRNMECVKNRLYKGKSRYKEDEATRGQYQKAQEALTAEDVLKYGIGGTLARLIGTKQGQPVTAPVPDIQTEEQSEPEGTETEPVPDIQTEEQSEPETVPDIQTEGRPNTPARSGRIGPRWMQLAESTMRHSIRIPCEHEKAEQPETSPLGEICARENLMYWSDCVEGQAMSD